MSNKISSLLIVPEVSSGVEPLYTVLQTAA